MSISLWRNLRQNSDFKVKSYDGGFCCKILGDTVPWTAWNPIPGKFKVLHSGNNGYK